MIVRTSSGATPSGATRYNDEKLRNGDAALLLAKNFPSDRLAMISEKHRDFVLDTYASFNVNISKPGLHFVLALSPDDLDVTDQKLVEIGNDFMEKMGYDEQPYLIYRHHDTNHPHAHIVSVQVDENGKQISNSFLHKRCNEVRKELEIKYDLIKAEEQGKNKQLDRELNIGNSPSELTSVEYGKQETKKAIGQVVRTAMQDYTFSRLEEFDKFLSIHNVQMNVLSGKGYQNWKGVTFQLSNGENPLSPAIKASSFSFVPTLKNLEVQFKKGQQKKTIGKDLIVEKIKTSLIDT